MNFSILYFETYIEIAEFTRIQYYDRTARNQEEFSSNDDVLIKDG
jgi:hypothetical protein